jgi:uncharacterized RDD family membrane protein YckC
MDDRTILDAPQPEEIKQYAGFWIRLAALSIDGIILAIPLYILQYAIVGTWYLDSQAVFDRAEQGEVVASTTRLMLFNLVSMVIYWLYFALQESSPRQATLGKQVVHIKVVDYKGDRISFGKATGRYFGKILSALILYIGFIMAAFTERKQALHDIMANTLVVESRR